MSDKHTPTPWTYECGSDGAVVYKDDAGTIAHVPDDLICSEANAQMIVAAVNSHAALVEALEECADRLERCATASGTHSEISAIAVKKYRDLLKLARGD